MKSFCIYWLPVIALAAAITIQSHFPSPEIVPRFPFADKLLHEVVYTILAVLCYRALQQASPLSGRGAPVIFLTTVIIVTLFGVSDEWHQSFIATRNADMFDLLADFIGSVAGAGGYTLFAAYLKAVD